jgi:hypothetical protein
MEDFERIKGLTVTIIKAKAGQLDPIKNWKAEIRKNLISVRDSFIQWIENFTNKFVDSLKNIEKSGDMLQN